MDNRDFSNIGEQVRRTVEEAMGSMNYQNLNQKINQTVNMAMNEAKQQFQNYQYTNRTPYVKPPYQENRKSYNRPVKNPKIIRINPKGKILSPFLIFFGGFYGVGLLMAGISMLCNLDKVTAGLTATERTTELISIFLTMWLVVVLFGWMFYAGVKGQIRYNCFKKYVKILDGREFCSIRELAERTHKPEAYVIKKLKAIIKKGMFVDGFVDQQGTCLIVTRNAYYQFQQAQESRRQREAEQAKMREAQHVEPESAVDAMIAKGNEYIESIRIANDAIPGEVISAKLDRLEMIIRKIFESVKSHPEQMDEMDKFMEYYLPTTQKLVNAYKEFDALPVKGENVTNSMNEIENTLDTISHAFEQLLDDLFQNAAFDISSDISVLQTMFAQEGYTEKDFK